MASVASSGTSPLSGYEFPQAESTGDPDENHWTLVPLPSTASASRTNSAAIFPSPASGSMNSWAYVDANGQIQASPGALSPLNLDFDPQASFPPQSFADPAAAQYAPTSAPASDTQYMPSLLPTEDLMTPGNLFFEQDFSGQLDTRAYSVSIPRGRRTNQMTMYPCTDLTNPFNNPFPPLPFEQQQQFPTQTLQSRPLQSQPLHTQALQSQILGSIQAPKLDIPQPYQSTADAPPWNPTELKTNDNSPIFVMEDPSFSSPSPPTRQSPSASPPATSSPQSPLQIKQENSALPSSEAKHAALSTIRKVKDARIQKRKLLGSESPGSAVSAASSSSSSSSNKFLIVTPDSVNAHAGKPNPWECFEALKPSQRGRKGPLASDTKENALQVRRVGACFCCHARKVKCDKERPCRNCKRLAQAVPQVVCWQFQDFLPVLFPDFFRSHFRKEDMTRFVTEHIDSFTVEGVEKPCMVELFSGARFNTTLTIRAKFFTPKTSEAVQHWHMTVGHNHMDLQARTAAPIGLDLDGSAQKDELKKKARAYIDGIVQEPAYADQVTDSLRHTELPRKILRIVQAYSYRCDAPIVKRALNIYAMHYVMTRHLCLTRQTITNLGPTSLVPQNTPWVTPRVLNRQLKSVVDEMLMREMTLLFESFSKSLKPKSRKEWAPCLAAFLVLCLFMEAVETTADSFVIAENEVTMRQRRPPAYQRAFALNINRELENLPFKQFAYQFHQIYQTHSKDVSARSFNPLVDDSCFEQAELDHYATEMVWKLREFVLDDNSCKCLSQRLGSSWPRLSHIPLRARA